MAAVVFPAPVRCVSSHLMSGLLTWRNPQGKEEGWYLAGRQGIDNPCKHLGKVVSTAIGLCLLATISVVETVVYGVLALASLLLYPITRRPCTFFAKLLQSSAFTIIWSVVDILFCNLVFLNIMTHESFAREWAEKVNPTTLPLRRFDDELYIIGWVRQHGPRINNPMLIPIQRAGEAGLAMIDQGAEFIIQDVLSGASNETLELFKDMDPSIFMFILTKAVYIYVAGSKCNDEIPRFFKEDTKNGILALRSELKDRDREVLQQLRELTTDPKQFETEPRSDSAKSAFNKLRNIASEESQGGLFIRSCWQKAVATLSKS